MWLGPEPPKFWSGAGAAQKSGGSATLNFFSLLGPEPQPWDFYFLLICLEYVHFVHFVQWYNVSCVYCRKSTLSTFWWAAQQGDHVLHHNQKGNCLHVWFGIGHSFASWPWWGIKVCGVCSSLVNLSAIYWYFNTVPVQRMPVSY